MGFSHVLLCVNVGTEEAAKSSPSLMADDIVEPRAPRKDLSAPTQTLVRSASHKRMLHSVCSLLFIHLPSSIGYSRL